MTKNIKQKFIVSITSATFIFFSGLFIRSTNPAWVNKTFQQESVIPNGKTNKKTLVVNLSGAGFVSKNTYVLLNHYLSNYNNDTKIHNNTQLLYQLIKNNKQSISFWCSINYTYPIVNVAVTYFNLRIGANENLPHFLGKWMIEIIIFLSLLIVVVYLLTRNSRIKLHSKRSFLEQKKYIDAERQRISSEMHDEIGAGLSAIKLFSEVASKNRKDVDEIRQINVMVNDIADKINEIIWSTNAESDNLESLFDFIEGQSRKLFEHSNILFTASIPINIPDVVISSQIRRDNYLLIKEVVHNALKHSQATKVHLGISITNGIISYSVKDNGIGFDPNVVKLNAMGLSSIKLRIDRLKGTLTIENYKGTAILIKIPLNTMVTEFKPKNFWSPFRFNERNTEK